MRHISAGAERRAIVRLDSVVFGQFKGEIWIIRFNCFLMERLIRPKTKIQSGKVVLVSASDGKKSQLVTRYIMSGILL